MVYIVTWLKFMFTSQHFQVTGYSCFFYGFLVRRSSVFSLVPPYRKEFALPRGIFYPLRLVRVMALSVVYIQALLVISLDSESITSDFSYVQYTVAGLH